MGILLLKSVIHPAACRVTRTFHGYHHSKSEILEIAGGFGFALERSAEDGYDVDFARSPSLSRLKVGRFNLRAIGRTMPDCRLLVLRCGALRTRRVVD